MLLDELVKKENVLLYLVLCNYYENKEI